MGRTLVMGDIHGGYQALTQVLGRAAVTTDDTLIFLGDFVDGWTENVEVVEHLITLSFTNQCVFLIGNHEELLLHWMVEGEAKPNWLKHGGKPTLAAYQALDNDTLARHRAFFESLKAYYLDDCNRLFLHAGFTHVKGVELEYFPRAFYWDRTLWECALALDPNMSADHPRYPMRLTHYDEIFVGHTPVTRIGEYKPVNAANVWNLDTGAAFDGPLSLMDVDSKEVWQSDPVHTFYPDAEARVVW